MNNVIHLRTPSPEPKQDSHTYSGHRIVLTFTPSSLAGPSKWCWRVFYKVELQYSGEASTMNRALAQAKIKIDRLIANV